MPMIDADGCLLNVSVEGRDGGPTLMLSNSLGCTLQMWEPQMKALTQLFRVIRYDRRGHGKSSAPPGPYSMERFGRDVLAILDDLNIDRFLQLLGQYSQRAQFIVVTHQKRTMEAADSLYGVSMGSDGISKVISRRLPVDVAAA